MEYLDSASLASLTRETGPKVVKGDPARKSETPKVAHASHHQFSTPTISVSDSSLKFTHVLYNLSPAGKYSLSLFGLIKIFFLAGQSASFVYKFDIMAGKARGFSMVVVHVL